MSDAKRQQRTILIVTATAFALVSALVTLAFVLANENAALSKQARQAELQVAELERDAKTAADRAQRARSQASELIGFFTRDLRDEIASIGRTDLLEAAARRAESYFEALPPDDIDAHSDVSHAKMLLLRGWSHHNTGALPESSTAFEKAIRLIAPHAEDEGADRIVVYTFLQVLNESSLPLRQAGRSEEAKEVLERALELAEKRHAATPDDEGWLHSRGLSLFGLGSLALDDGEFTEAVALLDRAIESIHRAAELFPTDINFLGSEMICHTSKGQALLEMEKFDAAEAATEAGAKIAEQLIEMEPTRKKWRKEYATLLNNFGSMLGERGELERARSFLDRSRGMRKELIAFDPANAAWRTDLANSESNHALQFLKEGNIPSAASSAASCIDHWGIVLKTDPENPDWHDRLRSAIKEIAEEFRDADAPAEAAKVYEQAARLFDSLGGDENITRRALVLKAAAERRHDSGNHQSAIAHWQKAFELGLQLHKAQPEEPDHLYRLASTVANIGYGHRQAGATADALRYYQFGYATYLEIPAEFRNRDKHLARDANTIRGLKTKLGLLPAAEIFIPMGSKWRYLSPAEAAPEGWIEPTFDDATWTEAEGQFGYGDGDETTVIDFGGDPNHKHTTAYFRHRFDLPSPSEIRSIHFNLIRDDGAVIYLNGKEVARTMLPEGLISYNTFATDFTENDVENDPESIDPAIDVSLLRSEGNVLAVEIHQVEAASSDLSFDLEVSINAPDEDPLEGMDKGAFDRLLGRESTAN